MALDTTKRKWNYALQMLWEEIWMKNNKEELGNEWF